MTNLSYELISTSVTDNYQVYGTNSTPTLLNGVVSRVTFKVMLTDFPDVFIQQDAMLDLPKLNDFLDLEELTQSKIIGWATATLSEEKKASLYNILVKKKDGLLPVTRNVTTFNN
jgi:hypothetical protein